VLVQIFALCRLAQLQQHAANDFNRYPKALQTLKDAEKQANDMIGEIKTALDEHRAAGEVLKKEAAARRESLGMRASEASTSTTDKGKGKERAISDIPSDNEDEDSDDKGLRNPAGEEHTAKRGALQHRLREIKLVLHKVKFLQGDVYHMLGEAYSSAEAEAYDAAEAIRRDLLRGMLSFIN
jgi:E3 ubiquitin-protein ligase SHPRH